MDGGLLVEGRQQGVKFSSHQAGLVMDHIVEQQHQGALDLLRAQNPNTSRGAQGVSQGRVENGRKERERQRKREEKKREGERLTRSSAAANMDMASSTASLSTMQSPRAGSLRAVFRAEMQAICMFGELWSSP